MVLIREVLIADDLRLVLGITWVSGVSFGGLGVFSSLDGQSATSDGLTFYIELP